MELTLLHSFLKASKLGQWLTWADCPQIFQESKNCLTGSMLLRLVTATKTPWMTARFIIKLVVCPLIPLLMLKVIRFHCKLDYGRTVLCIQWSLHMQGIVRFISTLMVISMLPLSQDPFNTSTMQVMGHALQSIVNENYLTISSTHFPTTPTSWQSSIVHVCQPLLNKLIQFGYIAIMHDGSWMRTTQPF